jgi:phage shock protein PspC (stress-responsive transcriptional regulator)
MSQPPPAPSRPPDVSSGRGWQRIVREPDDRRIAGVCSGLADAMGVDVTLVRIGAVTLALITPWALIAYLVASVAVPERRPDQPRVRARKVHLGHIPHPVVVIGAIVAVATFVEDAWWLRPFPAAVALLGVGVYLIVQGHDDTDVPDTPAAGDVPRPDDVSTVQHPMAASPWVVTVPQHLSTEGDGDTTLIGSPPDADAGATRPLESSEGAGSSGELPPPASPWWSGSAVEPPEPAPPSAPPRPRRSRLGSAVVALLLMGTGFIWLLVSLDIVDVSWSDGLALGLVVVGLGLVVSSWWGRAYALVPVGCGLVALIVLGEALDVPLDAGTGDRTEIVDTAGELAQDHELFAGDLTVDLTDAPLSQNRTTRVEASVGAGDLQVVVPPDATVVVDAAVRIGQIRSPGEPGVDQNGVGLDESFTMDIGPDAPRLELDVSVGFGSLEVTRG